MHFGKAKMSNPDLYDHIWNPKEVDLSWMILYLSDSTLFIFFILCKIKTCLVGRGGAENLDFLNIKIGVKIVVASLKVAHFLALNRKGSYPPWAPLLK